MVEIKEQSSLYMLKGFRWFLFVSFLLMGSVIRWNVAVNDKSLPVKDAVEYDQIAQNLVNGMGFRDAAGELTSFRPPLYPYFLAGIYRVAGHNFQAVRRVQAFLSILTILLIAGLAQLLFGKWTGCFAGMIAAVYPPFYAFYFSSSALISETLYTFLIVGSLCSLFLYFYYPALKIAVISGVLWGTAILTRPIPLFLLPILPFIFLILKYPVRKTIQYWSVVTCMTLLCVTPWIARNYVVFKKFVPVSTQGGISFYASNHPQSDGLGGDSWRQLLVVDQELKNQGYNEAERSKVYYSEAIKFIAANPVQAARLFLWKMVLYMDPTHTMEEIKERPRSINWAYVAVLAGAVVGFLMGIRTNLFRRSLGLMAFIFCYFLLFHAIFHTAHRYRLPTEPILIIMAAFMLDQLGHRIWAGFKEQVRGEL